MTSTSLAETQPRTPAGQTASAGSLAISHMPIAMSEPDLGRLEMPMTSAPETPTENVPPAGWRANVKYDHAALADESQSQMAAQEPVVCDEWALQEEVFAEEPGVEHAHRPADVCHRG